MSIEVTNFTNHFLIAMPNLADPNFFHTVTYICTHSDEGAMGIIINRPIDLALGQILSHMNMTVNNQQALGMPVYQGGPVQPERGFVIHRPVSDWDSSMKINDELSLTSSRDILQAIAEGDGPEQSLIALGYAGWEAGQLEQELADNAWLTHAATNAILFEVPVAQRWQAAADQIGIDMSLISSQAGHA